MRFHEHMDLVQRRRRILLSLCLAPAVGGVRAADPYPSQPIKMFVGFSPGSATNVVARAIGDALGKRLGQPVVIDNRTGAGGSLAADVVAKAPPDGHTLLLASSSITINPAVYSKLAFDVARDLTPICLVARSPLIVVVHPKVPANSLAEFVNHAKSSPGKLNYGSSGLGGSSHMATELFAMDTGIQAAHIPYRGNSQALAALLAGDVDFLLDTVINAMPHIAAQKVRALALLSDKRSALVAQVPTLPELGYPRLSTSLFFGVLGPAGLPATVVERLNRELLVVLKDKDIEKRLVESGGLSLEGGSPEEFRKVIADDLSTWRRVAADAKVPTQ